MTATLEQLASDIDNLLQNPAIQALSPLEKVEILVSAYEQLQLEASILEIAYTQGVPNETFPDFLDEMMEKLENLQDGEEFGNEDLEAILAKHNGKRH